jgi:hypothetical protein
LRHRAPRRAVSTSMLLGRTWVARVFSTLGLKRSVSGLTDEVALRPSIVMLILSDARRVTIVRRPLASRVWRGIVTSRALMRVAHADDSAGQGGRSGLETGKAAFSHSGLYRSPLSSRLPSTNPARGWSGDETGRNDLASDKAPSRLMHSLGGRCGRGPTMRISIVGARCLEQRALMRGRGAEGLGDGGSTADVHDLFSLATLNMSSVAGANLDLRTAICRSGTRTARARCATKHPSRTDV